MDKTTDRNLKTIVNYTGNPRLVLAPMFVFFTPYRRTFSPTIPLNYIASPRDTRAKKIYPQQLFWQKFSLTPKPSPRCNVIAVCHTWPVVADDSSIFKNAEPEKIKLKLRPRCPLRSTTLGYSTLKWNIRWQHSFVWRKPAWQALVTRAVHWTARFQEIQGF